MATGALGGFSDTTGVLRDEVGALDVGVEARGFAFPLDVLVTSLGILWTTLSCRSTKDSPAGRCLEELERVDPEEAWARCQAALEDEGAVRLASFCEGETGVLRGVC